MSDDNMNGVVMGVLEMAKELEMQKLQVNFHIKISNNRQKKLLLLTKKFHKLHDDHHSEEKKKSIVEEEIAKKLLAELLLFNVDTIIRFVFFLRM